MLSLSFPGKEHSLKLAENHIPPEFINLNSGEALSKTTLLSHNVFLQSDNLCALKSLQNLNVFFDFIYIDPPYNTSSKLTYNDNHSGQSSWLNMMLPRLVLAHKILSEEGVFFISIDDREVASLTLLMREIFGVENHIGTIKWRKKRKPSFLDKHLSSVIEYVLVFSKNKNKLSKLNGVEIQEKTRPVLNASNAEVLRVLERGTPAFCQDGFYKAGVYKNRTLGFELLDDLEVKNNIILNNVNIKGRFRVNQDILNKSVFMTKNFGLRRNVLEHEKKLKHATDDATVGFETNEDGQDQLKKLFNNEKIFEFPKPVGLIKRLLKMYSVNREKILGLDFFAGTATFAQAVLELNKELDKQKYSFCCIQNEEKIVVKSRYNHIAEIAQARIEAIEEANKILPKCKIFSPKL